MNSLKHRTDSGGAGPFVGGHGTTADDGLFSPPRARSTDPWTSHAAAASASGLSAEHRRKILEALADGPATKDGIAERCGLEQHRVGKRLSELERAGMIETTGRTIETPSGRHAREWRVKP